MDDRHMTDAASDARVLADARADFRWLARAGLIMASEEEWQSFVAGCVAMDSFYKRRAMDRPFISMITYEARTMCWPSPPGM
jgi:hypothetical protein